MCGISGIIKSDLDPSSSGIELMVARLKHRGPDANAYIRLKGCYLGHNRLSVIDLHTGDQPMSYDNERYWITYNGEIYNYRELKKELTGLGCQFKTQSDTEVLLASYKTWGAECLERFRGMFSFAIWDNKEQRLFAARDIFGEKPFYYAFSHDGAMYFASEIKAIVASGAISPRLNLNSVDAYLALGYVPPYRCIYENINILPFGHYLIWESGKVTTRRYWSPHFDTRQLTLEEAGEELLRLLRQAIRRQMVADVPVGAFLSGGLDSSTVVALLQQFASGPTKTFSVGFGRYINELPYARLVANKYGTEHHEIDVGEPPVAELLGDLGLIYDEPHSDLADIPTYLISQYARRFVKVVLSGDGGDELFGGYNRYPKILLSENIKGSHLRWITMRILSRMLRESSKWLTVHSVAEGLAYKWKDIWMRGAMYNIHIKPQERKLLWGPRLVNISTFNPNGNHFPPAEVKGLDRVFFYDITSYIPGDIMVKMDRAAMANGLEARSPLLDRDLSEFCLCIPSNLKVNDNKTKIVLKHAAAQYWPEELKKRSKQGFNLPYQVWLRREDVKSLLKRIFRDNSPLRSLLSGLKFNDHSAMSYNSWILLTLGVWLENQGVSV